MLDFDRPAFPDRGLRGPLVSFPELRDLRAGCPPLIDNPLALVLWDSSGLVHGRHSSDASAVAQGQLCDFAALSEVAVDAMLLDRHLEHTGRRRAVYVAAIDEDIQAPLFPGQPRDHAGLDG